MPAFFANGEPQRITLFTGPNYVSLGLVLADEPTAEPYVIHRRDVRCGEVDVADIRQAVADGVNEAHAKLPLRLYPWEIQLSIERWSPDLVSRAARDILSRIATSRRDSQP